MRVNVEKILAVSEKERKLLTADLYMTCKYDVKPRKPRDPLKAVLLKNMRTDEVDLKLGRFNGR